MDIGACGLILPSGFANSSRHLGSGAATRLFLEIDIGKAGIPVVKTHHRHHADFVSLYVANPENYQQ
jgi:hypothetical protein